MRTALLASALCAAPLAAQTPSSQASIQLDGSLVGDAFSIDAAATDSFALVGWSSFVGGKYRIYVSRGDGSGLPGSWSAPTQIDVTDTSGLTQIQFPKFTGVTSGNPSLYAEGQNAYMVWIDGRNGLGLEDDIYFARSTTEGSTWEPDVRLDKGYPIGSSTPVRDWAMTVSPDPAGDHIYVLMRVFNLVSFQEELWLTASHDSGASFSSSIEVSTGGADIDGFDIAAEGDVVHCSWVDSRNGSTDVWYSRSDDGGATFNGEIQVDTAVSMFSNVPGDPSIVACDNVVAIAWGEVLTDAGNEEVRVAGSADGGTTFFPDTRASEGDPLLVDCDSVELTLFCGGLLNVVWADDRSGSNAIYSALSTDLSTSWGPNARLTPEGAGVVAPTLTQDDASRLYLSGRMNSGVEANYSSDLGFNWAVDGGFPVTDTGFGISGPFAVALAYSPRYEQVIHAWISDQSGQNDVYVGGYREQTLDPVGFTSGGNARFDLSRFNVGSPALTWVFGSLTPSLTLPLPFGDGRLLGLTLDGLLLATLSNPIFLTTLDGSGSGSTGSFPVGLAPGTTFYAAAVSLNVGATVDFLEITGVEEITVQ